MKTLSTTLTCFCLFCTLNAFGQGGVVKRLATARPLKPLNMAAFSSTLSQNLLRQSFTRLVSSPQVAALSPAEQTLLLTHKFVEETQRLPRTTISGKAAAEYTFAQQLETNLGRQFRRLREDPKTPAAIRQESIQLQRDFSSHFVAMRALENLNDWITKKQSWPRATITHDGPLTEAENYEMSLAQAVEQLVFTSQTLPKELIDQLALTRAYYDPSYVSAAQRAEEQAARKLAMEERQRNQEIRQFEQQRYSYIEESPAAQRTTQFYNNAYLPIDPATARQQVRPTRHADGPLPMGNPLFEFAVTPNVRPLKTIHNWQEATDVFFNLEQWLREFHTWPETIPQSQFLKASLQQKQGHFLALQMESICELDASFQTSIENLYEKWISQKDTYNP